MYIIFNVQFLLMLIVRKLSDGLENPMIRWFLTENKLSTVSFVLNYSISANYERTRRLGSFQGAKLIATLSF